MKIVRPGRIELPAAAGDRSMRLTVRIKTTTNLDRTKKKDEKKEKRAKKKKRGTDEKRRKKRYSAEKNNALTDTIYTTAKRNI